MLQSAAHELRLGLRGLLETAVPIVADAGTRTGGIVLTVAPGAADLNKEGYRIANQQNNIVITAKTGAWTKSLPTGLTLWNEPCTPFLHRC